MKLKQEGIWKESMRLQAIFFVTARAALPSRQKARRTLLGMALIKKLSGT
jgi:hypothetical protein